MVDRKARKILRDALLQYMTGEIDTFAFDDANCECMKSTDASVQKISRFLYNIHDDFVDHPISVTSEEGWGVLRRVLAFLDTDLAIDTTNTPQHRTWPFHSHEEWHANEHRTNGIGLPQYDPMIHSRPIHHCWDRIPLSVGIALFAALVLGVLLAVNIAASL